MEKAVNMKKEVDLDNNYYLKIDNDVDSTSIDITELGLIRALKKGTLLLKINFKNLHRKQYKKVLRKLLFIKKIITKRKIDIGIKEDSKILLGYIVNYDENNKEQNDFILAINAIFYNTKYERYNYIYDEVCDYLDSYFYGKNLCDFKDNKCGEKRNTTSLTGCCHHFKYKKLGPYLPNNKLVLCEYLNKENYTCDAKCLPCKLFTCHYLEKKGIKFRIKEILLLDVFFNPLQKYFIKYQVFTPKEKIIKLLRKTGW